MSTPTPPATSPALASECNSGAAAPEQAAERLPLASNQSPVEEVLQAIESLAISSPAAHVTPLKKTAYVPPHRRRPQEEQPNASAAAAVVASSASPSPQEDHHAHSNRASGRSNGVGFLTPDRPSRRGGAAGGGSSSPYWDPTSGSGGSGPSSAPSHQQQYRYAGRGGYRGGGGDGRSGDGVNLPQSERKPSSFLPVSDRPYFADQLRPKDAAGYRAAGILAFRRVDGGKAVQFLFGREGDASSVKKHQRLNLLGGKIEDGDGQSSAMTACREFYEESGGLLDQPGVLVDRLQTARHGVLWYRASKYALYFYELTTREEVDIVDTYAKAKAIAVQSGQQLVASHSEMLDLHWVDCDTLTRYIATQHGRGPQEVREDPIQTTTGESHPMVSFAVCLLGLREIQQKIGQLASESGRSETTELTSNSPATAAAASSSSSTLLEVPS